MIHISPEITQSRSDFLLTPCAPYGTYSQSFRVPSSKPETQRALIMAAQADGVSHIYNDLRCSETDTMKQAFRCFGVDVVEKDDHLVVSGCGGQFKYNNQVIDSKGSGLVFRVFTALATTVDSPVIISGDSTLRKRIMAPLFQALRQLGADIDCIVEPDRAPIVNWQASLQGGECTIPGNLSSQFITAVLLAAPLAQQTVDITVTDEVYSQSYIQQTVAMMRNAGVQVDVTPGLDHFTVQPTAPRAARVDLSGDYTSASYLLAWAALFPGMTTLKNLREESLQGEREIIEMMRALGLGIVFDAENDTVFIQNNLDGLKGDYHFDIRNCPNIAPTLAAISAFVEGSFKVTGAAITRFHKCSRVEAIANELQKLGVDIQPIYTDDNACDGFVTHGRHSYEGGEILSSWGDHRLFMSLYIASLRMKNSNKIDGHRDIICSYPSFLEQFNFLTHQTAVLQA
ncbi:MAG: 3-phosphoshikimate 1-carboxyvinyltransferase [Microcoleaceae cyanobacterium]